MQINTITYSEWQGHTGWQSLTVAQRGCVRGVDRGCSGTDRKNTGGDMERQGIDIRTGVFIPSSIIHWDIEEYDLSVNAS